MVDGDGDLKDAAGEGGDEEAVVEGVPLGALAEPAGTVVEEDVGGGMGELEGDEVGDGDGGDKEEDDDGLGGAEARAGHEAVCLVIGCFCCLFQTSESSPWCCWFWFL